MEAVSRYRCWKHYAGQVSFLRPKKIPTQLGVWVSVTVIAIACLRSLSYAAAHRCHDVIEAIKTDRTRFRLLMAGARCRRLFYLTFYDWFAVRAIAALIFPYRIDALAAFASLWQ